MKRVLYLVLKSSPTTFHTLEELKGEGYNMTLISSESLRHAIEDFPEEHHFYTLRHFEERELQESILCIFVGDEEHFRGLVGLAGGGAAREGAHREGPHGVEVLGGGSVLAPFAPAFREDIGVVTPGDDRTVLS